MRVNYFDMGLLDGEEINMMLEVFGQLDIKDYHVYGFEAMPDYSSACIQRYRNDSRIQIFDVGVGPKNGDAYLYLSKNNVEGHSIYSSKNNVSTTNRVKIQTILFSSWLEKTVPSFRSDFNILKANIEGAEMDLLRDLDAHDLFPHFPVFCGQWNDVYKVGELQSSIQDFRQLIEKHNLIFHHFSSLNKSANADIAKVIKECWSKK